MSGERGGQGAQGTPLGPPHLQVGCFQRDGLLRCERTEVTAAPPSRGAARDPSRRPEASKPRGPSQRDAQSEAALAGRMQPRRGREDDAALGFPDPPRFGSLIQGADRPAPDLGMQWRGQENQLLAAEPVGLAVASAGQQGRPPPRVVQPVPTVASLMYSN